jgi:hypothetical protein
MLSAVFYNYPVPYMGQRKGKPTKCEKCGYEISSFFFKQHSAKCDGIGPKWATQSERAKNPGVKYSPGGWNTGLTKETSEGVRANAEKVAESWKVRLEQQELVDFESLSQYSKKKRLIAESGGACNICGLSVWMGATMPLHLDHIDGDRRNGARDNLRVICPNCHAQTPTYCGKDRKYDRKRGKKYDFSEEDVIRVVKESKCVSVALDKLGVGNSNYRYHSQLLKEIMNRHKLLFTS